MVAIVGSCNMFSAPANPVPGEGHCLELAKEALSSDCVSAGPVVSEQAVRTQGEDGGGDEKFGADHGSIS
jgi:hypothetical protein